MRESSALHMMMTTGKLARVCCPVPCDVQVDQHGNQHSLHQSVWLLFRPALVSFQSAVMAPGANRQTLPGNPAQVCTIPGSLRMGLLWVTGAA